MSQKIRIKKSKRRRGGRGPNKFYLCPTLEGITVTINQNLEFWKSAECHGVKYPPAELLLGNRYLMVYEEIGKYRKKSRKYARANN